MIKGLNVEIDGNYLLMRAIYILVGTNSIEKDLGTLLAKDMKKIMSMYNYDNIYFCSDCGHSWRKDLLDKEYKCTRKKDDKIDWDMCFREYNIFKEKLKRVKGINVIEKDKLEGDDIICYLVRESNKLGYSNFIISRDQDIQQVVEFDLEKDYINFVWNYNKRYEKVFVPNNYNVFKNKLKSSVENCSLFDMNNDSEIFDIIKEISRCAELIEISKDEILFNKLVSGDKGDNVPSVLKLKKGKIDPTANGIGLKTAEKIYGKYVDLYDDVFEFNSEDFLNKAVVAIALQKKVKDDDIKEHIKKNLKQNIRLVKLDDENLPSDLLEYLETNIKPLVSEKGKDDFEGGLFEKISDEEQLTIDDIIKKKGSLEYEEWQEKTSKANDFFSDTTEDLFGNSEEDDSDFWNI